MPTHMCDVSMCLRRTTAHHACVNSCVWRLHVFAALPVRFFLRCVHRVAGPGVLLSVTFFLYELCTKKPRRIVEKAEKKGHSPVHVNTTLLLAVGAYWLRRSVGTPQQVATAASSR